jgi:hypothetical protein
LDEFIDESRAREWNIVFPDTVRNGRCRRVLWNGSPNPPLVQRIAAWMLGLTFIGTGLCFIAMAVHELRDEDHPWIGFGTLMLFSIYLSG